MTVQYFWSPDVGLIYKVVVVDSGSVIIITQGSPKTPLLLRNAPFGEMHFLLCPSLSFGHKVGCLIYVAGRYGHIKFALPGKKLSNGQFSTRTRKFWHKLQSFGRPIEGLCKLKFMIVPNKSVRSVSNSKQGCSKYRMYRPWIINALKWANGITSGHHNVEKHE